MSKPTLTYFPIEHGRGFSIRAALRHAKVDFNDERVGAKAFMTKFKSNPEKSPFGSLPVLELPGQGSYAQTTALARWAARKSDLYPTDPVEALVVDEAMESINEFLNNAGKDAAQRQAFLKDVFPKYMNYLTARVTKSGGPFLLGKRFSIADLLVYGQLRLIYSGFYDGIPGDIISKNYPVVDRLYTETENHPITQAELKSKAAKL